MLFIHKSEVNQQKKNELHSYLKYGYILNNPDININIYPLEEIDGYIKDMSLLDYDSLVELIVFGKNLILRTCEKLFYSCDNVIPLSGGLDSRAILACLLEFTEAKNIQTYTFGVPGSFDYEFGNLIAQKMNTEHTIFNLENIKYSIEELEEASISFSNNTILFYHFPYFKVLERFSDSVHWSGFMGDPITGSHLLKNPSANTIEAKKLFLRRNTFVKSLVLSNMPDMNYYNDIDIPINVLGNLTIDEIIDFYNRQTKYIMPHVICKSLKYIMPFLDPELVAFFISMPNKYRYNQLLYKEILNFLNPQLFNLPTKNNRGCGLKPNRINYYYNYVKTKSNSILSKMYPRNRYFNQNYLNYGILIKQNDYYRKLFRKLIKSLKKRNIIDWLDINDVLNEHIYGNKNHTHALITLASLEINYRAKDR